MNFGGIEGSTSNELLSEMKPLLDCDTNVNIYSTTFGATDVYPILSNSSNHNCAVFHNNFIYTTNGNNSTNVHATQQSSSNSNWSRDSNDKSREESKKRKPMNNESKDNIPNDNHVLTIDEQPSNIINAWSHNPENEKYPYGATVK